jgi:hypothetical protein
MKGKRNTRGAALMLAILIATILSMLIGSALLLAQQHSNLDWADARSEAALLMAEGGANDELQYIAKNASSSTVIGLSSQPTVENGETQVSPFTNAIVKGRKGTIDNLSNGNFWVYSTITNPSTGGTPVAWDGKTTPFWIVSTAYVNGSWRRISLKSGGTSVFSLNAIFALASYSNNSPAIQMQDATVTVVGSAGTNGQVTNNASSFVASNLINANTASNPTGQFSSSNLASGGTIFTRPAALVYPTVTTVLARELGYDWAGLKAAANLNTGANSAKLYTYKGNAASSDITSSNCMQIQSPGLSNMLTNQSTGSFVDSWAKAGYKPGTTAANFTVSAATNASPISITTSKRHRLSTGDSVTITGVVGNTAANGTWTVTVPSGGSGNTSFTLNSSVGNGAYVSGGLGVKNISIVSASGTAGSTITVTTSGNHNLSTGDSVYITGNTAANGTWTVTVANGNPGRTAFTLNGSVSTGSAVLGGIVKLNAVQTLIFEPGDYYFESVNVLNDPYTELVIDSQALASGGTPGQVRFWVYATPNSTQNDLIQIPIVATKAVGEATANPQLFRVYYGVDRGVFSFQRPSSYTNYDGSAAGDFNVYGAIYAVTKLPGDTSSLSGTDIDFVGQGGAITLSGALIADQITFHYICNVNFVDSSYTGDPFAGAGGSGGGYTDG